MPKHLSLNGETAVCGPYMGGLTADSYTTDPDQMDCMECEALLGRPQDAATVAVAYDQGYADGKEKSLFELENWRPDDHARGCGCRLCSMARAVLHKVLGQSAWR